MEVEQYGYHRGHAVDLSPVMLVTQFRVTDKVGMYLCAVRALVFKGSILVYNPARDEAELVPACGITNNLSWVEEKSAVALVNFVPHVFQEAARITALGTRHLMSWPNDSSSEDDEQDDEQEDDEPEGDEHEEAEGQGEVGPESPSGGMALDHRDKDDRGSGGLSWMRKNLLLLMTCRRTPMPQLVATPLYV